MNAQWPINWNFNKTTHAEDNLARLMKICQYLALYLAGEKSRDGWLAGVKIFYFTTDSLRI